MPSTFVLITGTTLGANTDLVSFTSIPQTYTDLLLVSSCRNSGSASQVNITFNSDTASNYSNLGFYTNMSTGFGVSENSQTRIQFNGFSAISGLTTGMFNTSKIYIPQYTTTQNRQISCDSRSSTDGNNPIYYLGHYCGLYRGTSAITRIDLSFVNNAVVDSSFYLYGIKKS